MKLSIDRTTLLDAVQAASRAAGSGDDRPILSTCHLRASSTGVHVRATDMVVQVAARINTTGIEQPGEACAPSGRLKRVLKVAKGETVELELIEKSNDDGDVTTRKLRVSTAHAQWDLLCEDPADFPPMPAHPEEPDLNTEVNVINHCYGRVKHARADDKGRYALNGILLSTWRDEQEDTELEEVDPTAGVQHWAAADGARIMIVEERQDSGIEQELASILIPPEALDAFCGLAEEGWTEVYTTASQMWLVCPQGQVVTQQVEGQFPDYAEVVPPRDAETTVTVDRKDLIHALAAAEITTTEETHAVDLEMRNHGQQSMFESASPDVGESKIALQLDVEGDPITVSFNPAYLADCAKSLTTRDVKLYIEDVRSPVRVDGGNDRAIGVVSPIVREDAEEEE